MLTLHSLEFNGLVKMGELHQMYFEKHVFCTNFFLDIKPFNFKIHILKEQSHCESNELPKYESSRGISYHCDNISPVSNHLEKKPKI